MGDNSSTSDDENESEEGAELSYESESDQNDDDERAESVPPFSHLNTVHMHPIIEFDAENQLLPVPRPQELDESGSDFTFAAQVIDNRAQGLSAESLAATA